MTDLNFLWYAARGAGIVSMLLFTGVMLLGLMTSGRWQARDWPRFITTDLHRNVSLLALVFLGIHIVTAIVDPYTSLGLLAALIPFAVAYKQFWLGLGVIALDLTLALIVTSLLRARIGVRTWRTIHWASYAAWPIAMLHGLGTGTDASALWMQAIVIGCVALVAGTIAWRALVEPPAPRAVAQPARPGTRPPGAVQTSPTQKGQGPWTSAGRSTAGTTSSVRTPGVGPRG